MTTRRLFAVLVLVFAAQTAHYAEHVTQLIQIYTLGIKPPEAHGLLGSVFDFEWVHFLYNIGLEVVLVGLWLRYRSFRRAALTSPRRGIWLLTGLTLLQGYHSVEHIVKLYQYLFIPFYESGLHPTPGILPHVTGWPIFLVHYWFNTIVWMAMIFLLWYLRPGALAQVAVRVQVATHDQDMNYDLLRPSSVSAQKSLDRIPRDGISCAQIGLMVRH